jgi:hypothetical protein
MDGTYIRCAEQDVLCTRMVLQEIGHIVHLRNNEINREHSHILQISTSAQQSGRFWKFLLSVTTMRDVYFSLQAISKDHILICNNKTTRHGKMNEFDPFFKV